MIILKVNNVIYAIHITTFYCDVSTSKSSTHYNLKQHLENQSQTAMIYELSTINRVIKQ